MDDRIRQLAACQRVIGYFFAAPELLSTALTHSSLRTPDRECNERLEFLGDSVLGLVITEELYRLLPDSAEGELTRIKSAVVSRSALYSASVRLGLAGFAQYARGVGKRDELPTSVVANLVEAVIGAIYLDAGYYPAREFVLRHLGSEIEDVLNDRGAKNYKSLLQHEVQQAVGVTPHYRTVEEDGPDHDKVFVVAAVIQGKEWGRASGANKKEAEQEAARRAVEAFSRRGRGRRRRRRRKSAEVPVETAEAAVEVAEAAQEAASTNDKPKPEPAADESKAEAPKKKKRRRKKPRGPEPDEGDAAKADEPTEDAAPEVEQTAAPKKKRAARRASDPSRMTPSKRVAKRPGRKKKPKGTEPAKGVARPEPTPDEAEPVAETPAEPEPQPVAVTEAPKPARRRRKKAAAKARRAPEPEPVEDGSDPVEEPEAATPAAPEPAPEPEAPTTDFGEGLLDEVAEPAAQSEGFLHPEPEEIVEAPGKARAPQDERPPSDEDFGAGL